MKQKTDETLDRWVRQTISQLPDALPPGSTFDSERLWAQLRPELQATPARRKIGMAWWIAAACLAGSTLGWFWTHQSTADQKTVVAHKIDWKADVPIVSRRNPNLVAEVISAKSVFIEKGRPRRKIRSHQKESHEQESTPLHSEAVEVTPESIELPAVAEVSPVIEKPTERNKPNVAATVSKRRFRVVHQNELQAEEEARPKLYRTDHFVRIGTEESSEPSPDETRQAFRLPLRHKPNQ